MKTFSDAEVVLHDAIFPGGVSKKEICDLEDSLGIRFPADYKAFLEKYGAAMGEGYQIAGLFTIEDGGSPLWLDVVEFNKQLRRNAGNNIPPEHIAISDDGSDYVFYLDTTNMRENETCPVLIVGPGLESQVYSDSFSDFVIKFAAEVG